MKKFKILGFAAVAFLAFASCSKDDNGVATTNKPFYIKITQDQLTRAEGDDMSASSVTFKDGYLLFTTHDEINRVIRIVESNPGTDEVTVAVLESGYTIADLDGSTNNCYLIGNLGNSISGISAAAVKGASYTALSNLVWTLNDLQDLTDNTVKNIPVYGHGPVAYNTAIDKLKAEFDVKPVAARLQIKEVKISDSDIESFKLAGIYINGFYHSMKVSTDVNGYLVDNGVDVLKYKPSYYASEGYSVMMEDFTASPLTEANAKPASKATWAYNIFPGQMPRIVLHFEEINFDSSLNLEYYTVYDKYATIAKYNSQADLQGSPVSIALAGNVYTVGVIDIYDYATQIDDVPEANSKLEGFVEINIIKWEGVDLYPQW